MSVRVPVCFCIFNRPDTTARVFERIRAARPQRLLVVGDGPRDNRAGEAELVEQCRRLISVDWPCDLQTQYAPRNLGCARRMASGITWAFEQAEQLIVLEDDCLPAPEFFSFCEELLDRYAADPQVMMISGDNFRHRDDWPASYFFSAWGHIWGWASWRRAWDRYSLEIPAHSGSEHAELQSWLGDRHQAAYWQSVFEAVRRGQIDTWDYSWQYAIFRSQGLVALPNVNLVSNIGHDSRATHTKDPQFRFANLPTRSPGVLIHPQKIERHVEADNWTFEHLFRPAPVEALPSPSRSPRRPWWKRMLRRARV